MRMIMVPLAALFLLYSSCSCSSHREEAGPLSEADREGYVLAPDEGEVLMRHSDRGPVIIKVSPQTGSLRTAMGTQKLAPRAQIPVHVHHSADEVLFIHRGTGIGRIGAASAELETGSTIFIPSGVWHGVESSDEAMEVVWYVAPAGLDHFFRDLDGATNSGTRQLTPEEVEEIFSKHGSSYRAP